MFSSLPLLALILIFAVAAAAVWVAGVHLSNSVDVLSTRWGLGQALGGLILLAIVTNLPEIAIVASGALRRDLGLAVGNILGGIAAQTVVLALLDIFGLGKSVALTYKAASLTLVLEAALVVAVLGVAIMGTQLPDTLIYARVAPGGLLIAVLWMAGLWLISKSRDSLPWHEQGNAPDEQTESQGHSKKQKDQLAKNNKLSTARTTFVFGFCALVTLVCGVLLESSGEAIASQLGMKGMVFGATVLAAATSLPELSTGLASIRLGDYQLAISDIFGGNAFLPVLFLLATLLSGKAVLPHAQKTDIYMTGLGVVLTTVYITGLIFRPKRQVARMGIDSLLVLVFYAVGIVGLIAISQA